MRRLAALVLAAMAVGCNRETPSAPPAEVAANVTVATDAAPAKGCADHWTVSLNAESFAHNGAGRTFPNERLDGFLQSATTSAKGAVNEACTAGEIDPAKAAAIIELVVTNASGAAEPVFAMPDAPAKLRLEHDFAGADLAIPSEMQLREGLACWVDPASAQCLEFEP